MEQVRDYPPDRLITYREAAEALGLPYFKIPRAAARGELPTYSLLNGRKYVKLRDIEARIRVNN